MKTIYHLAISRLKYNKGRSILTIVAIALMTTLLMSIGSSALTVIRHQQLEIKETRVRASVERREDRAVREVMNKAALERSTIPQNGWWQIRRDDCMGGKMEASIGVRENWDRHLIMQNGRILQK